MAAKIKKGDAVVVLAGKNKGKVGRVLKVSLPEKTLTIEGIASHNVRLDNVAVRDWRRAKIISGSRLGKSQLTGKDVLEPYPKKGGKDWSRVRNVVREVLENEG